jgi:alpha-2-macroglobulin
MKFLKNPWVLFLLLLLGIACTTTSKNVEAEPGAEPDPEKTPIALQITLQDGEKQAPETGQGKATIGVPLSQARVEELLALFTEPLEVERDKPEFLKRPDSKPAPRSATPKEMTFPPSTDSGSAPTAEVKELAVLSVSPEGILDRAPRLSISFNNPLIAVSDPTKAEVGDPMGIKIEPRPEGRWRWLGTQTIIFEPTGSEFPRATEYKVTVPAGLADVNGSKLAGAVSQTFTLPRPSVAQFHPTSGGLGLEPLIYVLFDQPVEPGPTLKLLRLKQGLNEIPLQQLTVSEADKIQSGISKQFEAVLKNRVFYFKAGQKLRPGTSYTLMVDKGIKSAEGPLLSQHQQTSSFSTYEPLTLSGRHPEEGDEVSPFNDFYLYFNNELDPEKFDPKWVTVHPPIEHLQIRHHGSSIHIGGVKTGNTAYTVKVSPKLTDTFGQALGQELVLTLKTGRAPKALSHGFSEFTVLDPTVKAGLPIYTTNIDKLDLEIYQVDSSHWQKYLGYLYEYHRAYTPEDRKKIILPGQRVAQTSVKLENKPDQLVSSRIDLSQYLDDGEGNLIVRVKDPTQDKEDYRNREFFTWVQGTKLGIDVEIGPETFVALVTNLKDGRAISGATVRLGESQAKSDENGSATLPMTTESAPLVEVESEGSRAFIPHSVSGYGKDNGWIKRSLNEEKQWFLFDDRGLYKPGEKAIIKGYARAWQRGPKGRLQRDGTPDQVVNWVLNGPRGNKLREGTAKLNAFSAVEIELEFPKETNLGNHQLVLSGTDLPTGYKSLNVQEFRRPEFEVTTKVISHEPHLLLGAATVEATASYYAGGGLAGSEVNYEINASASTYTPPGRGKFTFGQWSPWWDLGCWWDGSYDGSLSSYFSFQGKADGEGSHQLAMDFVEMYPPKPTSVRVTASVADVNRQQQASTTTLLVHPSKRYAGLRAEKSFVDEKGDFELESIVTDIDGKMLIGIPLEIKLFKVEYEYSRGQGYQQKEKLVQTQSVTSSETPNKILLTPQVGGTYKIRARVADDEGRLNQTEYTFWKAGGELPTRDKVELETLTVVPDRREYEPGQKAQILVMAPFAEGEGMVVWSRDGVLSEERFTLNNGTATLQHTLSEEMIPNLRASITAVGKAKWGKRERPAVAVAKLNLAISKTSRELSIEIQPAKSKLEPGAAVDVPVLVKDHTGKPVANSEVTLWVVDEALLGLTGYTTPDPLSSFYGDRPDQLTPHHNRTFVALGDPSMEDSFQATRELLPQGRANKSGEMSLEAPTADAVGYTQPTTVAGLVAGKKDAAQPTKFAVRKNFDALAMFKGDLKTDASGRTTVKVKLPDNLTRYRIMSVAVVGDDLFGHGDELLTARLPIMVRPSLPRFLNFGDKAKLPVVIQNQTDKSMQVDVVGQASGVTWLGAVGQSVKVPANDRAEILFEAQADVVGRAHFRFGAVSEGFSDAATLSLPVYTPASGEAFATYGSITEDTAIKQPVRRPADVWTQFGGLNISLSSTALSELTDAFLYLYEYPYECAEQKSSRILAIAAMREVLSAFNPEMMPSGDEIKTRMKKDILHLERLQNGDGGWQYWRREEDSVPFVSLHVMHALARAKTEGYQVNESTLESGLGYLRDIEAKCRAKDYGLSTTRSCIAYALYVRNLQGDADVNQAKSLFTALAADKDPDLDAIGWLWPTLSQHAKPCKELTELRRMIKNKATQTADKAQFSSGFGEGDGAYLLLYSSRRTDAILLAGLLGDEPNDQLNGKLVRGLLAHRQRGRWNNTQENIWILLALQSYFREYEKETPDFLASLWLDSSYLGEEAFKGRSGKEAQLHVPMDKLSPANTDLLVAKQGAGRLYYRIGMKYAPQSLRLPAENRGFLVERNYKGLNNEEDVTQLENGDWKIKAGAKVEVTLTMVAPERRYHVALVDQLPAGLEPLNPSLKGTPPTSSGGSVSESGKGYYGWWWHWYEHDNLRDERVEAFGSLMYPGVYTYTYTALATTPGEFVLPPLKAEEMYSPEVFGRTATGRLIVE